MRLVDLAQFVLELIEVIQRQGDKWIARIDQGLDRLIIGHERREADLSDLNHP